MEENAENVSDQSKNEGEMENAQEMTDGLPVIQKDGCETKMSQLPEADVENVSEQDDVGMNCAPADDTNTKDSNAKEDVKLAGGFKMPMFPPKVLLKKTNVIEPEVKPEDEVKSATEKSGDCGHKENVSVSSENKEIIGPKLPPTQKPLISTIPYTPPSWSGIAEPKYSFEILKNGLIIDNIELNEKEYHVFGRLPSCDVSMEHPSLSRYHAVVQYCAKPEDKYEVGWYLYDLDSTHGTWINKLRLKPLVYYRLRVGHVVKFGGSSRLHILQGPEEDQEEESELSLTQIKEQREKQKKEVELLRQADLEEERLRLEEAEKLKEEQGCSWGIQDEAVGDFDGENPFALAEAPQNEDLYIDDPKKALKGYFEREGLDLPEYIITEMGRGKYQCTVELPIDGPNGEPVIAEASVTGKKREAVVATALEACRLLDRHGELRKANQESRKKKQKNWEDNDFYESDEDTFLDRTGDIERKRQMRMKKAGKVKEKSETYETLVSKLKDVEEEMKSLEKELAKAKSEAASLESDDIDALDAYMTAIKSGAMDTKTRIKIKCQLFNLKKEQIRLLKLADVARPASLPSLTETTAANKPGTMFGKIRGAQKPPRTLPQKLSPKVIVRNEIEEEEEDEDDDEDDKTKVSVACEKVNENHTKTKQTVLSDIDRLSGEEKEPEMKAEKDMELPAKQKDIALDKPEKSDKGISEEKEAEMKEEIDTKVQAKHVDIAADKPKKNYRGMGPTLPAELAKEVCKRKAAEDLKYGKKIKGLGKPQGYNEDDPDYAVWVPPQGQTGDGRTHLNEKFGY